MTRYEVEPGKSVRFTIGLTIAGVLTADTIWLATHRDSDLLSRLNPWITLVLSLGALMWAIVPARYAYRFNDGLWLAFGWWVVLACRLLIHPQPTQVTGYDRISWLFVYFSMAGLAVGIWYSFRKIR